MSYEVTTNTKRYWAIGDRDFIEQVATHPKPTFELKPWCHVDEETLRKLHAAIAQCLTDLASEREKTIIDPATDERLRKLNAEIAAGKYVEAGDDDRPF